MRKTRRIALSLVLAVALLVVLAFPAGAANPTVSITVTAEVVSITNTQATWTVDTPITVDAIVYFSADDTQDDDYSQIENTGSVSVDVEIQGTDLDGTDALDWTLAAAAGSETYSLYTNGDGEATYDIEIKSSSYTDICTDLAADGTVDWSMKLTAPTAFNAGEDGEAKTATVTLVASKHT